MSLIRINHTKSKLKKLSIVIDSLIKSYDVENNLNLENHANFVLSFIK